MELDHEILHSRLELVLMKGLVLLEDIDPRFDDTFFDKLVQFIDDHCQECCIQQLILPFLTEVSDNFATCQSVVCAIAVRIASLPLVFDFHKSVTESFLKKIIINTDIWQKDDLMRITVFNSLSTFTDHFFKSTGRENNFFNKTVALDLMSKVIHCPVDEFSFYVDTAVIKLLIALLNSDLNAAKSDCATEPIVFVKFLDIVFGCDTWRPTVGIGVEVLVDVVKANGMEPLNHALVGRSWNFSAETSNFRGLVEFNETCTSLSLTYPVKVLLYLLFVRENDVKIKFISQVGCAFDLMVQVIMFNIENVSDVQKLVNCDFIQNSLRVEKFLSKLFIRIASLSDFSTSTLSQFDTILSTSNFTRKRVISSLYCLATCCKDVYFENCIEIILNILKSHTNVEYMYQSAVFECYVQLLFPFSNTRNFGEKVLRRYVKQLSSFLQTVPNGYLEEFTSTLCRHFDGINGLPNELMVTFFDQFISFIKPKMRGEMDLPEDIAQLDNEAILVEIESCVEIAGRLLGLSDYVDRVPHWVYISIYQQAGSSVESRTRTAAFSILSQQFFLSDQAAGLMCGVLNFTYLAFCQFLCQRFLAEVHDALPRREILSFFNKWLEIKATNSASDLDARFKLSMENVAPFSEVILQAAESMDWEEKKILVGCLTSLMGRSSASLSQSDTDLIQQWSRDNYLNLLYELTDDPDVCEEACRLLNDLKIQLFGLDNQSDGSKDRVMREVAQLDDDVTNINFNRLMSVDTDLLIRHAMCAKDRYKYYPIQLLDDIIIGLGLPPLIDLDCY